MSDPPFAGDDLSNMTQGGAQGQMNPGQPKDVHWLGQTEGGDGKDSAWRNAFSPEAASVGARPSSKQFLFGDSPFTPIFQAGKLRYGEAKLSNLPTVRLLVCGRSRVQTGAQGLELLMADLAA